MKIYLAARYSRHAELEVCAADLRFEGIEVVSRWHKGEHQALDADLLDNVELARRFAEEDVSDLCDADLMISFTEPPHSSAPRGGRHVELGLALARAMAIWIVGPRENIFHCLPGVLVFDTWPAVIRELRARKAER